MPGKGLIQHENDVIGGKAIGGGVRYHLPIGPLRIDAAYNPGEWCAATES